MELDAKMREAKLPAEEQALEEWDDAFEHLSEEDLTYAFLFLFILLTCVINFSTVTN